MNGNMYDVSVYSSHETCIEIVALGIAISHGEHDFQYIVADDIEHSDMIYSICGDCWQFMQEYVPDCEIIVSTEEGG